MKYKKVSIAKLNEFRKLLELSKMDNLLNYFDTNIMQSESDNINDIKKMIYNDMQRHNKGTNENKQLYKLYQELKKGEITKENAMIAFMSIGT